MWIDIVISGLLAFIMLGIGMSLRVSDFRQIRKHPLPFMVGLGLQVMLVPILSFCIAYVWPIPATWKVGFMILAICPGGTTASFLSFWFKGNVALSIVLMSVNSLITLITIPIITNFSLSFFVHSQAEIYLPFGQTVLQIFLITILPALGGMVLYRYFPKFAGNAQIGLKYVTVILLGVVFVVKIFGSKDGNALSMQDTIALLPITLLLNFMGLGLGYFSAKVFRFSIADGFTIGVEMAIHNTSLAFLVAGTLLHNDDMIKPALVYSVFSFWTAAVFGWAVMRKRSENV